MFLFHVCVIVSQYHACIRQLYRYIVFYKCLILSWLFLLLFIVFARQCIKLLSHNIVRIQKLKVPGPISQNGDIYSNDALSPKKSWFQISVKAVKPFGCKKRLCILQLQILCYCISHTCTVWLVMVTITSHIFINIMQTVHFSAVKFTKDNEKIMSFLLIPKSLKVWKKSEAIGPGTFNWIERNATELQTK